MADPIIEKINKMMTELIERFTPDQTLMTKIAGHMHASVMNNFETQGRDVPGGWPDKMFPGRMLEGTGNLIRSIQASATEDTARAYTNYRSAALQHFGGDVKAKKILGSVSRKKDVYAMEQFFWSKWYQSNKKENMFKYIALHVHKHGKITVKARPFMILTSNYENAIVDDIYNHVLKGN